MKIAIADDQQHFLNEAAQAARDNLAEETEIVPITRGVLRDVVNELSHLQRDGKVSTLFSDIDLVLLDYDLRNETDIGLTTGADIARLLRTHTHCGPIILTNPFVGPGRERRFDLHLTCDLELMSDMEVASNFLPNPGLWQSDGWDFFRPSTWPIAADLPERLTACAASIEPRLNDPVVEVLPWLGDHLDGFSSDEIQWIGESPTQVRLRDIAGSESLSLLSPPGRAAVPEEVVPRYVASRLMKWLDQYVRVRGIVLVDAPHLVAQQPEVLSVDPSSLINEPFNEAKEADVLEEAVNEAAGDLGSWSSRPVWWMDETRRKELREAIGDKKPSGLDSVFCEDTSRFLAREEARSYLLDIPSPYRRRWIADDETFKDELAAYGPDYQPAHWLAM